MFLQGGRERGVCMVNVVSNERLHLKPSATHPGSLSTALARGGHSRPCRVHCGAPSMAQSLPIVSEKEKII